MYNVAIWYANEIAGNHEEYEKLRGKSKFNKGQEKKEKEKSSQNPPRQYFIMSSVCSGCLQVELSFRIVRKLNFEKENKWVIYKCLPIVHFIPLK